MPTNGENAALHISQLRGSGSCHRGKNNHISKTVAGWTAVCGRVVTPLHHLTAPNTRVRVLTTQAAVSIHSAGLIWALCPIDFCASPAPKTPGDWSGLAFFFFFFIFSRFYSAFTAPPNWRQRCQEKLLLRGTPPRTLLQLACVCVGRVVWEFCFFFFLMNKSVSVGR